MIEDKNYKDEDKLKELVKFVVLTTYDNAKIQGLPTNYDNKDFLRGICLVHEKRIEEARKQQEEQMVREWIKFKLDKSLGDYSELSYELYLNDPHIDQFIKERNM